MHIWYDYNEIRISDPKKIMRYESEKYKKIKKS